MSSNHDHGMGDSSVHGTSINIDFRELMDLFAHQIASDVAEKIRKDSIEPLTARIGALEVKIARPTKETQTIDRWHGALDVLWKLGVALVGMATLYRNIWGK